jgi:hypothetical protein
MKKKDRLLAKSLGRHQPSAPKLYSNAQGTEELSIMSYYKTKFTLDPKIKICHYLIN